MNHPVPAYRLIADRIARQIGDGVWVEGARLPPERRLAADLGVAVGTLRKALELLTNQGLLERRQGSGNYVRPMRDRGGLYGFFRLERVSGGGRPGATVLSLQREDAGYRIRRVRTLDDIPVAVEDIVVAAPERPGLTARDLGAALYRSYRALLNLRIVRVEDRIGVATIPDWAAPHLERAPGAALGHVARRSWTGPGDPTETSDTWFNFEKARYVSRLDEGA